MVRNGMYPAGLLDLPYDLTFAIRGLHFDVQSSCLLKVDAYSQIQTGAVYRGRRQLSDEEVKELFPGLCLPNMEGRQMPQLIDLFSLPWAGLLSTVVHYCDTNKIVFDPKSLFNDLAECVKQVHITGEMYRKVSENLKEYVHPNEGLKDYLETALPCALTCHLFHTAHFYDLDDGVRIIDAGLHGGEGQQEVRAPRGVTPRLQF
ncbi:hypothetical protein ANCDUO_09817 [Ancylostoma duodenale]|uniref:Uncharacterized protein n=1 Tax=Ancylostoma duodenale TaxID=51022 RepID=A0A0C2GSC0_9BILA|nr:hypothetical protein ANCDUO_09817 [Ancylostoma duodenale]